MAGKPSLAEAVLPVSVSETRKKGRTALFDLADAKEAIGLLPADPYDDAELLLKIDQAQAMLERMSGLALASEENTAEYCLRGSCGVLCIPRSDVGAVSAITEYDAEGNGATLASANYEAVESLRQYYVRRTDGEDFQPQGADVAVSITFSRLVEAGEQSARLVVAAMKYIVAELDKGGGMTTAEGLRTRPALMRIISVLKGNHDLGRGVS